MSAKNRDDRGGFVSVGDLALDLPGVPVPARRALVPQIEAWEQRNGLTLPTSGWKSELATREKHHLLLDDPEKLDEAVLRQGQNWRSRPSGGLTFLLAIL